MFRMFTHLNCVWCIMYSLVRRLSKEGILGLRSLHFDHQAVERFDVKLPTPGDVVTVSQSEWYVGWTISAHIVLCLSADVRYSPISPQKVLALALSSRRLHGSVSLFLDLLF
jgi:hypothetical protein